HPAILAMFIESSSTAVAMCFAGAALLVIGIWAARKDIAQARGLDKIVALANLCYAAPLAVFGALHLFGPDFVKDLVPPYMPGRMFWVYFVGCALIAASLSIATKIQVRWSGLLVGIMMFLFVAMLYLPAGLRNMHARIIWTIVFRESSFGGAAWILAAMAKDGWRGKANHGPERAGFSRTEEVNCTLIIVGRIMIMPALIFFGIQHFLHPMGLPGVPLQRQLPPLIPGQVLIDYVTGAGLLLPQ
ncbi:MAG TPA: hypothetical protein VFB79_01160, partial [Candidatus Angelobacter sp.]|nr:hypothetical protein [Candidatus Angelobacter sp.]